MPKNKPSKLDRCVAAVEKQGKPKSAAYPICNASLHQGKIKKKG